MRTLYIVLFLFSQNEETLKACVEDYQGKLQKTEERLLKLKEVAEEKLKALVSSV